MRLIFLGWLSVWSALAQFTEIAATDDGSQIYVTTQLVTDGIEFASPQKRIFQITSGTASLFAQSTAPGNSVAPFGSIGAAIGPQISGDGTVGGYTLSGLCKGNLCSSQYTESYLQTPGMKDLGAGNVQLSRNGRWALLVLQNAPSQTAGATLIDLQSGGMTGVPLPPSNARAVASDGSVLTSTGIWKSGTVTPVSFQSPNLTLVPASLSDDASTIVYGKSSSGHSQLIAHDVASGNETLISDSANGDGFPVGSVSLSTDGRTILYTVITPPSSAPIPFIRNSFSGQNYRVPLGSGESMTAGVLNGPGTSAFLATSRGRIVQVTITGSQLAMTEVLPPTPYLAVTSIGQLTPGSLSRLQGSVTGTVDSLQGHLLLDGVAMPVLAVSGNTVTVQVPWEVRTGLRPLVIDVPNLSPFHQDSATVLLGFVEFEPADSTPNIFGLKLLTEDFNNLAADPLPAGSVLHGYLTGLGPVNGPVQTGMAVDPGALISIQSKFTCRFKPQSADAETLFAGLAPGLIGVYQVDLRLPDEGAPVTVTGLSCTLAGKGFSSSISVGLP